MSIVKFHCNSWANIHSCQSSKVDTVKDIGLAENEWEEMSEDEKYKIVEEWAFNSGLEIYWTEE